MATSGDGDDVIMMSMDADDSKSKVDYEKYDNESESHHSIQSYDDCSSLLPSFKILPQLTFEKCVLTIGQVDTTTLSEDIRQLNFVITGYKPSLIIEKENPSVEDIIKISDLIQKYMEHKQTCAPFPVLSEDHGRLEGAVKDSCEAKDKVSVRCKNTLTSEDTDITALTKKLEDFNMKEEKKKEVKILPALQQESTIDKSLTSKKPQTGKTKKKSNSLTKLTNMENIGHDREEPDSRKTKDQVMPTVIKENAKKNEFNVFQAPKETMQSPTVKHSLPPMDNSCLGTALESDREGLEDGLEVESRAGKNFVEKKSDMKQAVCAQEDMKGNQGNGQFKNGADKISHGKAGDREMSELDCDRNIEKEHLRQEKFSEADGKSDIETKPQDSAVKKTHCCAQHGEQELKNKKLKDEKYDLDTSVKYNEPRENYSDTQSDKDDKPGANLITISKQETKFKALKFYFADTEYNSYFTKEQRIELDGNSKQGKIFLKMLKGIGTETLPFSCINQEKLKKLKLDEGNVKLHVEKNNITLIGPKEELKPVKSKIISCLGNQDHSTQWHTKQNTADMEDEEDEEDEHDYQGFKRNKDKNASQGACKNPEEFQLDKCKSNDSHRPISTMQAQRRFTFQNPGGYLYYIGHNNPGLLITIEYFDITKLKIDVVVNAANIRLKHGGGVARAIAKAAGEDLAKECDKYISRNEKLDVTDVFVSTAGNLPSKKVMHAVGPKWEAYEDKIKCVNDLRQTVLRCLIEASRLDMSSIALPSISAAIFKVPKDECAKCYMEASKNYDYITHTLKITPVQKIVFVDVDTNILNTIQDYFKRKWDFLPDDKKMQDDLEFVKRHLSRAQKKVVKSSKLFSALLPSSDGGKKPAADSRSFTEAKGEWYDYVLRDMIIRIRTEPVVDFKADLNIVLGPAFKKLSGITDFEIKKCLALSQFPCKSNVFQYYLLEKPFNKTHQSRAALLCIVHPLPKAEDDLKHCFEHLNEIVDKNLLFDENGKSPSSLTLTSSFLFPENKERNLHKFVAKFAGKLFEFVDRLSLHNHTIKKVTVCTSEETSPQVIKVFDSRNTKKVPRRAQGINSQSRHETENMKSGRNSVMNQPASPSQSYVPSHSHWRPRTVFTEGTGSHQEGQGLNQGYGFQGTASSYHVSAGAFQGPSDLGSPIDLQDICHVCYESRDIEPLKCCQALMCSTCLDKVSMCPFCRFHFKILIGTQPIGDMSCTYSTLDVDGFERKGSLMICYYIPAGVQTAEHQHPGKDYKEVFRSAYLPATDDGYKALRLLRVAFHRRLIFTIDVSNTTQNEGIVWNIHHKTSRNSSANRYGYPDPEYLVRLMHELAQYGVAEDSMTQEEKRLSKEFIDRLCKYKSTSV